MPPAGSPLPSVSLVIPAHNSAGHLGLCLDAVAAQKMAPLDCIVVDDASSDTTAEIALNRGARLVRLPKQSGPAAARNAGARIAEGALVLFLDSDVVVPADAVLQVARAFYNDPQLDALMGCYDDAPGADTFASHFEGLHHHYMHQSAPLEARSLAGFCSAVSREVFLESGGFSEQYDRPSIEDVEFGLRLARQGKKVRLLKELQVKHLKRWTLIGLVRIEIFSRAVPWAQLMLSTKSLANGLNLATSQKLSAILVIVTLILGPFGTIAGNPIPIAASVASLGVTLAMNSGFYRFLYARRGAWFLLRAIPMHLFYFLYATAGFALGCAAHLFKHLLSPQNSASVTTEP
jgi:GT2 family glycosyltransferase